MNASKTVRAPQPGGVITIVLFAVALVWLGLQLLAMNTLVAAALRDNPHEIANLVIALSGLVVGNVFAGGVAGLSVANWAGQRESGRLAELPRLLTAALGGLLVAVVLATAGYLTFSQTPALGALIAGAGGVSAMIGGCLAAPKSSQVVTAGLTGTAVLLGVFFLRGYFLPELLDQLGRDIDTYRWTVIIGGLLAGVLVGITAYLYLRRQSTPTPLYGYVVAGAAPGILWLLSEVITQIAAGMMSTPSVAGIDLDSVSLQLSAASQFNGGMTALFAGATTAVLAFGLLMPSKDKKGPAPKTKADKKKAARDKAALTAARKVSVPAQPTEDKSAKSTKD